MEKSLKNNILWDGKIYVVFILEHYRMALFWNRIQWLIEYFSVFEEGFSRYFSLVTEYDWLLEALLKLITLSFADKQIPERNFLYLY